MMFHGINKYTCMPLVCALGLWPLHYTCLFMSHICPFLLTTLTINIQNLKQHIFLGKGSPSLHHLMRFFKNDKKRRENKKFSKDETFLDTVIKQPNKGNFFSPFSFFSLSSKCYHSSNCCQNFLCHSSCFCIRSQLFASECGNYLCGSKKELTLLLKEKQNVLKLHSDVHGYLFFWY